MTFKQASWDYVQDTVAAAAKWGDIGDWDVSGVKSFAWSFSVSRDQAGNYCYFGECNPKAATFGANLGLSDWDTSSVTCMYWTFKGAANMNADFGKWDVSNVNNNGGVQKAMRGMFKGAANFQGTGLDKWDTSKAGSMHTTFSGASAMNSDLSGWDVSKVADMGDMFDKATSLDSCNKRKIANAWKGNIAFTYTSAWAVETCTVR